VKWKQTARGVAGFALVSALLFRPEAATATFPGENGMLAVEVESGPFSDQIVILNPDGSFGHYFPFFQDVHHGDPNWSPDGRLIVFNYDNRIAVAGPDGSGLTLLTEGSDEAPKWSPDQTRILFQRFDFSHDSFEIYAMDADGAEQANLTQDPASDTGAQWAPNGSKIAFSSDRASTGVSSIGIYVMNPDGSGLVGVTHGIIRPFLLRESVYSWSPDSLRIVFSSASSPRGQNDISSVSSGGMGEQRLTRSPANDIGPVWGPDGRIAFASNRGDSTTCDRDCNYDIFVMDSDGGNLTRLTNDPAATIPLQWSPNGTKILFAQFDPTRHDALYVMNADGSGVSPLETRDDLNYATDWQPLPPG